MRPSGDNYYQLRLVARAMSVGVMVVAFIYSLVVRFAISEPGFPSYFLFVPSVIILCLMFVGVAIIAWHWSLIGGLCVVVAGGLALKCILSYHFSSIVFTLFAVFCIIYIIGGVLHLVRACLIRIHRSR